MKELSLGSVKTSRHFVFVAQNENVTSVAKALEETGHLQLTFFQKMLTKISRKQLMKPLVCPNTMLDVKFK